MSDISKYYSKFYADKLKTGPYNGPKGDLVALFLEEALDLIYPGMIRKSFSSEDVLKNEIEKHLITCEQILQSLNLDQKVRESIISNYRLAVFEISQLILEDAEALLAGDPAAIDLSEVVLSYPGLYAIATYRLAHFFYQQKVPIIPRMLSELAHTKTGIDIHPGACIGRSFFIDHGTGVVIGETCCIGHNVKIYQGVTLGALSVEKSLAFKKRHPTIEDDCIIYSHATILGGETVIGAGSLIGGNVWLTRSVPRNSIVYHRAEIKLDKKVGFNQEEEISYEI